MSETANALNDFKKRRDEARRNYAKVLRIISTVNIDLLNIQDMDSQKAKVEGLAGEMGTVYQLVQLLNQKLDALSPVQAPTDVPVDEIIPQDPGSEEQSEFGVGGEPSDMVEMPIESEL